MDTKKGCGFAAVYLSEAQQCLYTINASDPRPEKGDETANIDCSLSKYVQTNRCGRLIKRIYVSVRFVLVYVKFADFA